MPPGASGYYVKLILELVLVLVFVLSMSSMEKCKVKNIPNLGLKLCQLKCNENNLCSDYEYHIETLPCRLSRDETKKNEKQDSHMNHPRNLSNNPGGACSTMTCELNTRCVERRGGGAVCVEEGHTVNSTLESSCLSDSDCSSVRKFVCFIKTCKCTPGFSFNLANNSCVRRCKEYGGGFTTYRGLHIKKNNDRRLTGLSQQECAKACIGEKGFVCITYDITAIMCDLSKSGYLDVPTSQRVKAGNYLVMATRNCA